jgi:uncharacterized SAM-binding protein YcdF (DUF218 family)
MLMHFKLLLQMLVLPPAGPLLLVIAGACLTRVPGRRGARRAGWTLLVAGIASQWLLATPVVANALSLAAQRCPALDLSRPVEAQAIVILGGDWARREASEYGGAPAAGDGLLGRVAYGVYVAHRTGLPLLISGFPYEVQAMRASLSRDFGVEPRWIESHSRDTFENARLSAPILQAAGVRRIILVTSAVHEWRAAHEFESAGLGVVPAPEAFWSWPGFGPRRYWPSPTALKASADALHEILGDLARRAMAVLGLRRQPR